MDVDGAPSVIALAARLHNQLVLAVFYGAEIRQLLIIVKPRTLYVLVHIASVLDSLQLRFDSLQTIIFSASGF